MITRDDAEIANAQTGVKSPALTSTPVLRNVRSSNAKRMRMKGRGKSPPFIALDRAMVRSPEWIAMTPYEVKLIIDLSSQYYGSNNGDLCATWKLMKARGWNSPGTLNKALKGAIKKGWLEQTRLGGRNTPTLLALTFRPIDECGGKLDVRSCHVASHRWQKQK